MRYILNGQAMTSAFFVPSAVVDSNLKLASHTQLKVLLVFLRNVSANISEDRIAEFLRLPVSEVTDALEFWVQAGVLASVGHPEVVASKSEVKTKSVKSAVVKPTREEISQIAFTDPQLSDLLRETERKFARPLRVSEMQSLSWLYLDHGMDISLILMAVAYAIEQKNTSTAFIERTALAWIEAGVTNLEQADAYIREQNRKLTAWGMVEKAFGIDRRKPSDKELEYASRWVLEWGFSREMLKEAYNRCIDQTAKLQMSYINKILERWYKEKITTPADIDKPQTAAAKSKDSASGAYDKKLVYDMLNKD